RKTDKKQNKLPKRQMNNCSKQNKKHNKLLKMLNLLESSRKKILLLLLKKKLSESENLLKQILKVRKKKHCKHFKIKWLPYQSLLQAKRSEEHTSELQSRFDLVC